ncbi:hypothetical protein HDU88_002585 [Geranomyces variabilis]|nr:hypothetical protein HDU88_002585 [Geranomyces variabilis]
MPTVPYTVAQQIVSYFLPDMMVNADVDLFYCLVLTCQSFKMAAYQHRKYLMFAQAQNVKSAAVLDGFPVPREAKNPFANLDYILGDCVVHAEPDIDAQVLIDKHRDHFDRDMSNGLIIVIAEDGAICTATHGRWLDGTVPRPVSLLMKDAIYLRSLDDPEYNASSLGVKCEFAVYFDDGHGSHAFWTPVNGRQEAKTAQLEFE